MTPAVNPTTITVPTANGTTVIQVPAGMTMPTLDINQILATQTAVQAATVNYLNAQLQAEYDSKVKSFNAMMESGSFPGPLVPPPAPASFILIPGTANPYTPAGYAQTGPPIVANEPIDTINVATNKPPVAIPGNIHVTVPIPGAPGWWGCGKDDGFPNGQTTPPVTADDGTVGRFQRYGAIGGAWYLKVS